MNPTRAIIEDIQMGIAAMEPRFLLGSPRRLFTHRLLWHGAIRERCDILCIELLMVRRIHIPGAGVKKWRTGRLPLLGRIADRQRRRTNVTNRTYSTRTGAQTIRIGGDGDYPLTESALCCAA